MSHMASRVAGRECGEEFAISIGTAIPIETMMKNPKGIASLFINVRTLYRNFMGALDDDTRDIVDDITIAEEILNELGMIYDYVGRLSEGKIRIVPYWCTHRTLPKYLPFARVKTPRTKLQTTYSITEQNVLKEIALRDKEDTIKRFDCELSGKAGTTFIISHHPVDLLSYQNFGELILIESHTGAIKDREAWHTKLTGGKSLTRLPFNRFTLSIFGDQSTLLETYHFKVKDILVDLSEKYKWTPLTTKDRIRYCVETLRDPTAKKFFKDVLAK